MTVQVDIKAVDKLPKNMHGKPYGYDFKGRVMNGFPVLVYIAEIAEDYIELELYDRKGYRAAWLEDKLTEDQWESLEIQAYEHHEEVAHANEDDMRIEAYIDYMGI